MKLLSRSTTANITPRSVLMPHGKKPLIVIMAWLLVVLVVGAAIAAPGFVDRLTRVSGKSPLPEGCGAHFLDPTGGEVETRLTGRPQIDSEVEPHVAVDPTDPDRMIAAWIQDRHPNGGGGRSNVVGVSDDGGNSWRQVVVPGISGCSGGRYARATDPWLDVGPDGVAYLASLSFEAGTEPSTILVSTSRDGGQTWGDPSDVTAGGTDVYNDKQALTAHPTIPGRAYMVWVKRVPFGVDAQNTTLFSSTSDHGKTWSLPKPLFASGLSIIPVASEILVLPDDTLLHVFSLTSLNGRAADGAASIPFRIMVQRSTDDGATWSAPTTLGGGDRRVPHDPDTGDPVHGYVDLPAADVAPDGTAYVTWGDLDSERRRIVVVSSKDSGETWSDPATAATSPVDVMLPSLAVGHRGTVAITYYSFENDVVGDDELTTDFWFAHSQDQGAIWERTHIAGPFDMRRAPRVGASLPYLGEYAGLDGFPSHSTSGQHPQEAFAAAFAMAPPLAMEGSSDIFVATVGVSERGRAAAGEGGSTKVDVMSGP